METIHFILSLSKEHCLSKNDIEAIENHYQCLKKADYKTNWLLQFLSGCKGPSEINLLLSILKELETEGVRIGELNEYIDDSCYSTMEWGEAFLFFIKHTEKPSDTFSQKSVLAYLNCCAEDAASALLFTSFQNQVSDMLETFGFEG